MIGRKSTSGTRSPRGSSARERAQWRMTYEKTSYDQLPWFEPGPSPCVKLAVDEGFLPKGGVVLDIGCGAGSNVLFLAENGYRAHGVDLSPGAVAAARSRAALAHLTRTFSKGTPWPCGFPTKASTRWSTTVASTRSPSLAADDTRRRFIGSSARGDASSSPGWPASTPARRVRGTARLSGK